MSNTQAQFSVLRQTADPAVVDAISQLIATGEDRDLNRINLLDFSARNRLDEEKVISAFLHSARLGLFDLSWNVLCPGCGGVLGAHNTLKSLRHDDYNCALCAQGYEASVDDRVEVSFTVSPRVRRIAAHDPNTLPIWEYNRQMFWSSGMDLSEESITRLIDEVSLEAIELPAGEKAVLSLQLPNQFVIVFEPVTHSAHFLDIQGELTRERQQFSIVFNKLHAPTGTTGMRPGPLPLVRAHFHALLEIIASEKGAVVKTIGDAVMATFIRPEHAIVAGLRMRAAMAELNAARGREDLIVKIGIHEGPCLAVMLNERQDYFGQTVNIASRVQSLSTSQEIHITGPVIESPAVATILQKEAIRPIQKEAALRGIADKMVVYEIP